MESTEEIDALLTQSEKVDDARNEDLSLPGASESALQNDLAGPVDDLMQEEEGSGELSTEYPYTVTQNQWNRRAALHKKGDTMVQKDHAREKAHTPVTARGTSSLSLPSLSLLLCVCVCVCLCVSLSLSYSLSLHPSSNSRTNTTTQRPRAG